ncbi:sugar-transfer associated ATP-grasp domain-containing protein [Halodesulfurarchaeum formicicum]|uniref:Alpha-L-glutamate ligase n=1 Tax=Halodesulfurarchaeum formicicum TaxID=1873524 RepID=A0A1J1AC95_9EURY|nr:sugar-transfer associated ATP-grasp domain-containing protein [Halodesulfurarchaeum formicicum]APE95766.1 alpha-L-glutamate ligase [Halodesulfurarchaeum formicicum]
MDSQQSRRLTFAGILLVFLVFALVLSWQFERLAPTVIENYVFLQLAVAATIIALFRSEVGFSTFGVFGPTIIAFAWIQVGPYWGLILITYLFVIAIAIRDLIEPLNLTTPHRVATVLLVVVFGLLVLGGVSHTQPTLPQFGYSLFFPAILTAWYGDRFVNELHDAGWVPVLERLLLTVVVISLAFTVVTYEPFMNWFARTPTAWILLVGINLYLGSVTTVRLSERLRFRNLLQKFEPNGNGWLAVLTLSVRNRDFVERYNPAQLLARLDKVVVKQLLHGLEIPTPATYAHLRSADDLDAVDSLLEDHAEFVVKPATSLGGEGILVVTGRREDGRFETSDGPLEGAEIRAHARDILEGRYEVAYESTGEAYLEALVHPAGILSETAGTGVPDVRVILLKGVPIMAMARLPTRESRGRANLHGGALAVGLDLETGHATGAFQQTRRRWLATHPDTGRPIDAIEIPDWEQVLTLASRAALTTHLGYAGVDVVFDREGPLVLEVNRRPGLGIQNATMDGLLRRLRYAEAHLEPLANEPAASRVRAGLEFARADWGGVPQ